MPIDDNAMFEARCPTCGRVVAEALCGATVHWKCCGKPFVADYGGAFLVGETALKPRPAGSVRKPRVTRAMVRGGR